MKNILLITNIYPNNDPEYAGTKVCHSFTTEWMKQGYNVRVIHFDSLFPKPYYWIGKLLKSRIQAKTGSVVYTNTPRKPKQYIVDGVPVLFVPLKKYIPHKAPSQKQTIRAFRFIREIFKNEGYVPDIITAHFTMPQLQFLPLFKTDYPNVKTCLVMHGNSTELPYFYPDCYQSLMASVDVWGFRSEAFRQDFEENFGSTKHSFICYSGIPNKYIETKSKSFNHGVKRFVFVGSLYKLKNVDVTLYSLRKAFGENEYQFDIVGGGAEEERLHNIVNELGIQRHVFFHGKKNRDDAQNIIKEADCFVMVSSREAFGLVYVEAMAKGCVVIGTKGQGIDGVIINGENGFLCEAGNVDELATLIKHINTLPPSELQRISENAIQTALNLTDENAAKMYINDVIVRM